jgi:cystathionine beta-lyase/cystathionine gamma-synthase
MIIMICVGCAIGIAGLVFAGIRAWRLVKAAQAAGIHSKKDAEEVARRVQELGPRIEETSRRAQATADNLQSLSASVEKLNYLKNEFDEAIWFFTRLKS